MQQLRRVGVLSAAKIMGLVYGLMGLVFLPFFFLFFLAASFADPSSGAATGALAMVVTAVMMPALYAAMGFLMGALGAFLYNAVAGWVGGIEFELGPPRVMTVAMQREVV